MALLNMIMKIISFYPSLNPCQPHLEDIKPTLVQNPPVPIIISSVSDTFNNTHH